MKEDNNTPTTTNQSSTNPNAFYCTSFASNKTSMIFSIDLVPDWYQATGQTNNDLDNWVPIREPY